MITNPEDDLSSTRLLHDLLCWMIQGIVYVTEWLTSFQSKPFVQTRMHSRVHPYFTWHWSPAIATRSHANVRVLARDFDVEGGAICSKNSQIGPSHGDHLHYRLTVSVLDYGSCSGALCDGSPCGGCTLWWMNVPNLYGEAGFGTFIHHSVTTTECTSHTVNHHTVTTTECTYRTVNHHIVHRNHHTVNL